jgi:ATP-dependent helicase/nuclease subunit A
MYTTAQELAIRTEGKAMIVEAGAGTGKTTVLTQRFLHLLDQHPDWAIESIVAVTFTEKAANEMRSRIRTEIEKRATDTLDPQWQKRRLEADRLQVSTIHSLCARILRENALSAALDPRFAVLDEVEALILREEAVAQTLRLLATEDHSALGLLDYIEVRTLERELGNLLQRRGTVESLFAHLLPIPDLLMKWRTNQARVWQSVWDAGRGDYPELDEAVQDLPFMAIPNAEDKLAAAVTAAQRGLEYRRQGDWVKAIEALETINLVGGKGEVWGGKEAIAELKAQLKAVREVAKSVKKVGATAEAIALDEDAAQVLHWWRDVWTLLIAQYDALKSAQNGLDFNDLERLALQLLQTEPRSRRLKAFVEGIRQLMVDEYQDTNPVQRDIVYALAQPTQPHFFVVGDVKQSIYRFREADVSVYHYTRQKIEEASGAIIRLSHSFRSHRHLVKAVNHLFAWVFTPAGVAPTPYEAPHGALESDAPPPLAKAVPHHVEMIRLPHKGADDKAIKAEESRAREAEEIAAWLAACEADGMPVRSRDGIRGFRFGDAVILLRSFGDVGLYEEALKAAGVPYITVGGRGYFNRPEVEDVLALLCALDNPADDLNLGAALRSPLFALSDETLFALRWFTPAGVKSREPIPFRRALAAPPTPLLTEGAAVHHAAQVLERLWALRGRVEVWELLQEAITATGYLAMLAVADHQQPGSRQRRNVEKLLELAQTRGGASLAAFVRDVQTRKINEVREGEAIPDPDAGVVQLMTIHAAKGLEFPVVVLADLGRDLNVRHSDSRLMANAAYGVLASWQDAEGKSVKPTSYQMGEWEEQQMETAENKRLLYVACTRAADWLLLIGQKGKTNCWLAHMGAAWDIPDEVPAIGWLQEYEGFRLRVTDLPH